MALHRTQVLLEQERWQQLRAESARTGRSLSELIRGALAEKYDRAARREQLRLALEATFGIWEDMELDGEAYVESIRPGMGVRMRKLGLG